MSAAYPLCENKYGLEVYEEEVIDAHHVEKLIEKFEAKLDEARAECLEQAQLNGMGAERELKLMAKLEQANRDILRISADLSHMEESHLNEVCRGNSLETELKRTEDSFKFIKDAEVKMEKDYARLSADLFYHDEIAQLIQVRDNCRAIIAKFIEHSRETADDYNYVYGEIVDEARAALKEGE